MTIRPQPLRTREKLARWARQRHDSRAGGLDAMLVGVRAMVVVLGAMMLLWGGR